MVKLSTIGLVILVIVSLYLINYIPESFGDFVLIFVLLPFVFIGMLLYKLTRKH